MVCGGASSFEMGARCFAAGLKRLVSDWFRLCGVAAEARRQKLQAVDGETRALAMQSGDFAEQFLDFWHFRAFSWCSRLWPGGIAGLGGFGCVAL